MRKRKIFPLALTFIGTFAVVLVGIQFITKTGIFKVYGEIKYDENVTEDEKNYVSEMINCNDCKRLDYDVSISITETVDEKTPENSYLSEIYVPVANFYDVRSDISLDEALTLPREDSSAEYYLIKVEDLDSSVKLLSIDGEYYLDTFNSGAIFRYLVFNGKKPEESLERIKQKDFLNSEKVLSFAQTGVTALSRAMYTKLNKVSNAEYFAAKIKDFLSTKDLTHISNEASFTNSASGSNICSSLKMFDAITAIGTDIVELTGNHNNDCGIDANIASINMYKEKGIKIVGGGENATAAAKPLQLSEKSTSITMLAYNYSTGGYTTGNKPGANLYSEKKAASDIAAAKERGDFVIIDFQYFECYCYPERGTEMTACDKTIASSEYGEYNNQKDLFRHLIDLGADVVVGTSAHQPQTYERYNDGEIYYGLGNLFFDQTMWPGTTRGIILTHYFNNGKLLQTRFSPTVYDTDLQVRLMNEEESEWFIARLNKAL